jgi:hypothetical protein
MLRGEGHPSSSLGDEKSLVYVCSDLPTRYAMARERGKEPVSSGLLVLALKQMRSF